MVEFLLIVLLIAVVYRLTYNYAFKKGKKNVNMQIFNEGHKKGIDCVEEKIKKLSELPNEEIIKRIKNFAKKKD